MSSGLRDKLRRIQTGEPRPVVRRETGVYFSQNRFPADAGVRLIRSEDLDRFSPETDLAKCLFLDTETTGLSGGMGTVAFLVGVGFLEGDEFVVEQYMMRDYSDEGELLSLLNDRLAGFDTLVTFNGKNFDVPLLINRFTMCRMRGILEPYKQIDLLAHARRVWKLRLGSCRLSALEEKVLGLPRHNDLPGSEVPKRFFDYVAGGDFALLEPVLAHNLQDIRTLLTLLVRLCEAFRHPENEKDACDLFSIGRVLEKEKDSRARTVYRMAAVPKPLSGFRTRSSLPEALANQRLAALYRREGAFDKMLEVLETMETRKQFPYWTNTALAKHFEHREKKARMAMRYAVKAFTAAPDEKIAEAQKRIERLEKKIQKQNLSGGKP